MKVTDANMTEVLASVKGDRCGALVVDVKLARRTTIWSVPSSKGTPMGCEINEDETAGCPQGE